MLWELCYRKLVNLYCIWWEFELVGWSCAQPLYSLITFLRLKWKHIVRGVHAGWLDDWLDSVMAVSYIVKGKAFWYSELIVGTHWRYVNVQVFCQCQWNSVRRWVGPERMKLIVVATFFFIAKAIRVFILSAWYLQNKSICNTFIESM